MNSIILNKFKIDDYNLDNTLNSGQCFVWKKDGKLWYGSTSQGLIIVGQESKNTLLWQTYPQSDNWELVNRYFRLDFNYQQFTKLFTGDEYIQKAIEKYRGLRLMKQDLIETIISYIIATNKNIPAIKKSIEKLSYSLGNKIIINNKEYYTFPTIDKIADAGCDLLKNCAFGYRVPYINQTANYLRNVGICEWGKDENIDRNNLLKLKGVGNKVADCVLVFALGYDNVTPLDVWGKRSLISYYGLDPQMSYEKMREWTKSNFKGYASWAGQYLFEYVRCEKGVSR